MLQQFRDNLKGVTAAILVGIIIIPFALWGVESLFVSGSGVDAAATVDGEKVTELDVLRTVELRRRAILNQFEDVSPEMVSDERLRGAVIDQLVNQKLIATRAKNGGMTVPVETFNEIILDNDAFKVNGRFDSNRYREQLNQAGFTPADYRQAVSEELLANQVTLGLQTSSVVTAKQTKLFTDVVLQKRGYQYLALELEPFAEEVSIGAEDVENYFRKHSDKFTEPDKVVVSYIELNPEVVSDFIDVDESEIRARFDVEKAAAEESGQSWEIAHILLADDEGPAVEEIQEKLARGEDFAELAKEYSDDFGSAQAGGDLGTFTAEALPGNFLPALESLKIGEVSAPVTTDSGTHLIKLLDRQEGRELRFAEERDRLEQELKRQKAAQVLSGYLERLREETYTATSLEDAADKLGLTAKNSQPFSKAGGDGIAARPQVVTAAFSEDVLEHGYASEVLDLGEDHYVVIKLKEFQPEHQVPLDQVRAEIESSLKESGARRKAGQVALELVSRLDNGATITDLAAEGGWGHATVPGVTRFDAGTRPALVEAVFHHPASSELPVSGYVDEGKELLVYSLTSIEEGDSSSLSEAERTAMRRSLERLLGEREFSAYLGAARAATDIKIKN